MLLRLLFVATVASLALAADQANLAQVRATQHDASAVFWAPLTCQHRETSSSSSKSNLLENIAAGNGLSYRHRVVQKKDGLHRTVELIAFSADQKQETLLHYHRAGTNAPHQMTIHGEPIVYSPHELAMNLRNPAMQEKEAAAFRKLLSHPASALLPLFSKVVGEHHSFSAKQHPLSMPLHTLAMHVARTHRLLEVECGESTKCKADPASLDPTFQSALGAKNQWEKIKPCMNRVGMCTAFNCGNEKCHNSTCATRNLTPEECSGGCKGLCGPLSSCDCCWNWVCGDCCYHSGCYIMKDLCSRGNNSALFSCWTGRGVMWGDGINTWKACGGAIIPPEEAEAVLKQKAAGGDESAIYSEEEEHQEEEDEKEEDEKEEEEAEQDRKSTDVDEVVIEHDAEKLNADEQQVAEDEKKKFEDKNNQSVDQKQKQDEEQFDSDKAKLHEDRQRLIEKRKKGIFTPEKKPEKKAEDEGEGEDEGNNEEEEQQQHNEEEEGEDGKEEEEGEEGDDKEEEEEGGNEEEEEEEHHEEQEKKEKKWRFTKTLNPAKKLKHEEEEASKEEKKSESKSSSSTTTTTKTAEKESIKKESAAAETKAKDEDDGFCPKGFYKHDGGCVADEINVKGRKVAPKKKADEDDEGTVPCPPGFFEHRGSCMSDSLKGKFAQSKKDLKKEADNKKINNSGNSTAAETEAPENSESAAEDAATYKKEEADDDPEHQSIYTKCPPGFYQFKGFCMSERVRITKKTIITPNNEDNVPAPTTAPATTAAPKNQRDTDPASDQIEADKDGNCPAGYSKKGWLCIINGKEKTAGGSVEPNADGSCPTGYEKEGSMCVGQTGGKGSFSPKFPVGGNTVVVNKGDNSQGSDQIEADKEGNCPAGYTKHGWVCVKNGQQQHAISNPDANGNCPTGTEKDGSVCVALVGGGGASSSSSSSSSAVNGEENGGASQIQADKEGNCPPGYTKVGWMCVKNGESQKQVVNPDAEGNCPSGSFKEGDVCVQEKRSFRTSRLLQTRGDGNVDNGSPTFGTNSSSASEHDIDNHDALDSNDGYDQIPTNDDGTCPYGYNKNGWWCVKEGKQLLSVIVPNEDGSCPKNSFFESDMCVVQQEGQQQQQQQTDNNNNNSENNSNGNSENNNNNNGAANNGTETIISGTDGYDQIGTNDDGLCPDGYTKNGWWCVKEGKQLASIVLPDADGNCPPNTEKEGEVCIVGQKDQKESNNDQQKQDDGNNNGADNNNNQHDASNHDGIDNNGGTDGDETIQANGDGSCPVGYTKNGWLCVKGGKVPPVNIPDDEGKCLPGFVLDGSICIQETSPSPLNNDNNKNDTNNDTNNNNDNNNNNNNNNNNENNDKKNENNNEEKKAEFSCPAGYVKLNNLCVIPNPNDGKGQETVAPQKKEEKKPDQEEPEKKDEKKDEKPDVGPEDKCPEGFARKGAICERSETKTDDKSEHKVGAGDCPQGFVSYFGGCLAVKVERFAHHTVTTHIVMDPYEMGKLSTEHGVYPVTPDDADYKDVIPGVDGTPSFEDHVDPKYKNEPKQVAEEDENAANGSYDHKDIHSEQPHEQPADDKSVAKNADGSCPNGYVDKGWMCVVGESNNNNANNNENNANNNSQQQQQQQQQSESANQIEADKEGNCPPGYSKMGWLCLKNTGPSPSSVEPNADGTCPSGFEKDGGLCVSSGSNNNNQQQQQQQQQSSSDSADQIEADKEGNCPAGYSKVGWMCVKNTGKVTRTVEPDAEGNCPSGSQKDGGLCIGGNGESNNNNADSNNSNNNQQQSSSDSADQIEADNEGNCPAGYTKHGWMCVKNTGKVTRTVEPDAEGNCPSGSQKDGGLCIGGNSESNNNNNQQQQQQNNNSDNKQSDDTPSASDGQLEADKDGNCPPGYSKVGWLCVRNTGKVDRVVEPDAEGNCPAGTQKDGGLCVGGNGESNNNNSNNNNSNNNNEQQKPARVEEPDSNGYCPAGFVKRGNVCLSEDIKDFPEPVEEEHQEEQEHHSAANSEDEEDEFEADENGHCPDGYSKQGWMCVRNGSTRTVVEEPNENGECPEGFELNGDVCLGTQQSSEQNNEVNGHADPKKYKYFDMGYQTAMGDMENKLNAEEERHKEEEEQLRHLLEDHDHHDWKYETRLERKLGLHHPFAAATADVESQATVGRRRRSVAAAKPHALPVVSAAGAAAAGYAAQSAILKESQRTRDQVRIQGADAQHTVNSAADRTSQAMNENTRDVQRDTNNEGYRSRGTTRNAARRARAEDDKTAAQTEADVRKAAKKEEENVEKSEKEARRNSADLSKELDDMKAAQAQKSEQDLMRRVEAREKNAMQSVSGVLRREEQRDKFDQTANAARRDSEHVSRKLDREEDRKDFSSEIKSVKGLERREMKQRTDAEREHNLKSEIRRKEDAAKTQRNAMKNLRADIQNQEQAKEQKNQIQRFEKNIEKNVDGKRAIGKAVGQIEKNVRRNAEAEASALRKSKDSIAKTIRRQEEEKKRSAEFNKIAKLEERKKKDNGLSALKKDLTKDLSKDQSAVRRQSSALKRAISREEVLRQQREQRQRLQQSMQAANSRTLAIMRQGGNSNYNSRKPYNPNRRTGFSRSHYTLLEESESDEPEASSDDSATAAPSDDAATAAPSDDSAAPAPAPAPSSSGRPVGHAKGDTHMETLDGCRYLQMFEGDFVMLQSVTHDVLIEGRFRHFGLGTVLIGLAIRRGGNVLELVGRNAQGPEPAGFVPKMLLNGQPLTASEGGERGLMYKLLSDNRVNINADGVLIACRAHPRLGMLNCAFRAVSSYQSKVKGLLGNFNGVKCDSGYGLRKDQEEETQQQFRIPAAESLFADKNWVPDVNFKASNFPVFKTAEQRKVAHAKCADKYPRGSRDFNQCVYDISLTHAMLFAKDDADNNAAAVSGN